MLIGYDKKYLYEQLGLYIQTYKNAYNFWKTAKIQRTSLLTTIH